MIRPGTIVIVHLVNPTEKLWGILQTLGLSTICVPLFRVERIFIDESIGEVESYRERFAKRVGIPVEKYLRASGEEVDEEESAEVPS